LLLQSLEHVARAPQAARDRARATVRAADFHARAIAEIPTR
jgi:hypothetical protein